MLYEQITESRIPKPRGCSTWLGIFSKIRTFIYWCNDNRGYANKSFSEFSLEECTYGTPVYITIDERRRKTSTIRDCIVALSKSLPKTLSLAYQSVTKIIFQTGNHLETSEVRYYAILLNQ